MATTLDIIRRPIEEDIERFNEFVRENFREEQGTLLGDSEQIIFPEIDYDKIEKLRGMNIAICTTAKTDEEARELLRLLGAPFMNA